MPIILRCQCGKETPHVYPANEGWTVKPQIGGTEVLCPDCRQKEASATARDNEALTRLTDLLSQRSISFAEYGENLFQLFREEQKKHGHEGCLCEECQEDMVNALRELLRPSNIGYGKLCKAHHIAWCKQRGCL